MLQPRQTLLIEFDGSLSAQPSTRNPIMENGNANKKDHGEQQPSGT
jgi:hypothetical protein